MALVTIRILDGPDRGKEFYQIATPVTVGREDGNLVQLNDHRVSRHHLKIHENDDALLITDLQSTNGTKINGESIRVWQLHPGDLITLGQSILLFGSATEIAERLVAIGQRDCSPAAVPMGAGGDESDYLNRLMKGEVTGWTRSSHLLGREIFGDVDISELSALQKLLPPPPPQGLSPLQAAQMEAFLQYLHLRLRYLVATVRAAPAMPHEISSNLRITISAQQWQNIVDLHARIAACMTAPTSENET